MQRRREGDDLEFILLQCSGSLCIYGSKRAWGGISLHQPEHWGVFCSWEGNEQQAIPLYYEQVCGLLNGERNKELGALEKWDFQKFQPDVVVVNLGTNDGSGTRDMEKVEKAVIDFLRKIRACNPESIRDICLTKRQRRYWQKKSGRFLAAARMFLLNEQKIMVNYL